MSDETSKLAAAVARTTAVLASIEAARIAEREQAAGARTAEVAAMRAREDELAAKLNTALDALASAPAAHAAEPTAPTGVELTPVG